MSFTHDFNIKGLDEVYFAYMYPYTFTRLTRFLKDLKSDLEVMKCLKDCLLCPSLSGVDVPYLIVTSRANEIDYQNIEKTEHNEEFLPISKKKK
jgi:ATP-dependent RNA circularization protein (DNA/RNA ligase family)